jgi:DNA replication and repair protein RecF
MSVVLKELKLHNFRNHRSFSLEAARQLIIILGANAIGKTNIIEALQLVSMLESFKNPRWQNVITTTEESGDVQARFLQNERLVDIQMTIKEGKRSYSLNGKNKLKNALKGLIPAILFVPDDLMLVKDSSEVRRKLLDDIGQQLSSTYLDLLTDYQKTVRQRNAILREQREKWENNLYPPLLESWDENLLTLGSLLFIHRIKLYKRLSEAASTIYAGLSKGELLTSQYIPSFGKTSVGYTDEELLDMDKITVKQLLTTMRAAIHNEEWIRMKTLVGPHRDEIMLFINGNDVRQYASQGQQRSVALALKLAQLTVVQEISGNQPLLLLDDVMSELDEDRRAALINVIDGQIQTVITATDLDCFNKEILKNAQIIDLGKSSPTSKPTYHYERQNDEQKGSQ